MPYEGEGMTLRQWVAFLLVSVFSGAAFMWNKQALPELLPIQLLLYRFALGTIFLVTMALVSRQRWRYPAMAWVTPVIMGLFNFATPHFLIAWGQQFVDSSLTGVLITTTPLFTLFIAHGMLRDDRLTVGKVVGSFAGFFGVLVVMSHDFSGGISGSLLGKLSILGAAFSFGSSSVVGRRLSLPGMSPIMQALGANITATIATGVAAAFSGPLVVPALPLTWGAVLCLGLFNSACMYPLFFYLLNNIGPSRTQMVTYVIPVVALLLGVLLLGEPLYWQLLAGGALIMAGIATVNQRGRPAPETAANPESAAS